MKPSRRRGCHSAASSSSFSRCFNRDGEGVSAEWQDSPTANRAHSHLGRQLAALLLWYRPAAVACAVDETVILLHPPPLWQVFQQSWRESVSRMTVSSITARPAPQVDLIAEQHSDRLLRSREVAAVLLHV